MSARGDPAAHDPAGSRAIVRDGRVEHGRQLDGAGGPAGLLHAGPDVLDAPADGSRRGHAGDHHAVGNPPAELQDPGTTGHHDHRDVATGGELERAPPEPDELPRVVDLLARQEASDQLDRFAQRRHGLLPLDPHLAEARAAGAEPEDGAPAGELVERGDRHRRERGMADVGVGDPGAELDPRGPHGRRAEADPHVTHPALIGDPVGVEPEPLAEDAQLGDPADRVRAGVVAQETRAESKVRRPRAGRHANRTRLCRALSRRRRLASMAACASRAFSAAMIARCSSTACRKRAGT